jgi:hypothetical protein
MRTIRNIDAWSHGAAMDPALGRHWDGPASHYQSTKQPCAHDPFLCVHQPVMQVPALRPYHS